MNVANPVRRVIEQNQPFIYFHTHSLTEDSLKTAIQARKSFEIDISIDPTGNVFAGHSADFYTFKELEYPLDHMQPDDIVDAAITAGLFIIFDCKDARALPWVEQAIKRCGAENALFHSWVKELCFEPYPSEIVREPQWKYEDLPLADVLALRRATSVPVVSSTRGLTYGRLQNDATIIDTIINIASGKIDAINFNLLDQAAPPERIVERMLQAGIMTYFNVDVVPKDELPTVYLGMTDHLEKASNR